MKIYYCEDCENVMNENEVASGWTKAIDCYKNDHCPVCGSECIIGLDDEKDLCPRCETPHEDDYDWEYCFDKIYSDGSALDYIFNHSHWTYGEIVNILAKLPNDTTLRDYIFENVGGKDFVWYIYERKSAKPVTVVDEGYYELIDTTANIKEAV